MSTFLGYSKLILTSVQTRDHALLSIKAELSGMKFNLLMSFGLGFPTR